MITILGTSFSAVLLIRFKPPNMTTAVIATKTKPMQRLDIKLTSIPFGTSKISLIACFSWLTLKTGNAPINAHTLKNTASGFHDLPKPSIIKYIGPPCILPTLSLPLYITASVQVKNFVDIPIIALIHIQNMAPGPPIFIATATPAMFPIPIVEANAVDKA